MHRTDVFLNAGDFFFHHPDGTARNGVAIRTLLGSCVSIVIWHPRMGSGGMSHSVVPSRTPSHGPLDGNHCEGAMALFLRELQRTGTRPEHYQTYLLGGSRMSLGLRNAQRVSVGERNIDACRTLLLSAGFSISGEHVGLTGPRRVSLDLGNGRIDVLHNNRTLTLAAGNPEPPVPRI